MTPAYLHKSGAPFLAETAFNDSPTHRNRLNAIVHILADSVPHGAKILDVGCGMGHIANPIASLGYTVHAIDTHEPTIREARTASRQTRASFWSRPMAEMVAGDYKVIILAEVIEHVQDHHELLREISVMMDKNTTLILTVPNGYSLNELLARPAYWLKRHGVGQRFIRFIKSITGAKDLTTGNEQSPHVHFFTMSQIKRDLSAHGLEIRETIRLFNCWPAIEMFFGARPEWESMAERDFSSTGSGAMWVMKVGRADGYKANV